LTRFVLQQNEVCYTKNQTFYSKTAEGRTKGAWEQGCTQEFFKGVLKF